MEKSLTNIQEIIANPDRAYKEGKFISTISAREFSRNAPCEIYFVRFHYNGTQFVEAYEKRQGSSLTFGVVYVELNKNGKTKANGKQIPIERAYNHFSRGGQFIKPKTSGEQDVAQTERSREN